MISFDGQTLKEQVGMAMGYASRCWIPGPTGVFDSTKCEQATRTLLSQLPKYLQASYCGPLLAFKVEHNPITRGLFTVPGTIAVLQLATTLCKYSPEEWGDSRMCKVHETIINRWLDLESGQTLEL